MRILTAVWLVVLGLVCARPISAQMIEWVQPSEVDLRAMYCVPVLRYMLDVARLRIKDPTIAQGWLKRQSKIEKDQRLLRLYLVPRTPYLAPDALGAARQSGEEDVRRTQAYEEQCTPRCARAFPQDALEERYCTLKCLDENPTAARTSICEDLSWLPW